MGNAIHEMTIKLRQNDKRMRGYVQAIIGFLNH